jgi:hypothetical protein
MGFPLDISWYHLNYLMKRGPPPLLFEKIHVLWKKVYSIFVVDASFVPGKNMTCFI